MEANSSVISNSSLVPWINNNWTVLELSAHQEPRKTPYNLPCFLIDSWCCSVCSTLQAAVLTGRLILFKSLFFLWTHVFNCCNQNNLITSTWVNIFPCLAHKCTSETLALYLKLCCFIFIFIFVKFCCDIILDFKFSSFSVLLSSELEILWWILPLLMLI